MGPNTILHYTDENDDARRKRGRWFDAKTTFKEFESIIKQLKIETDSNFRLEIKDCDGNFVDFDEYYLQTFKPYGTNTNSVISENQVHRSTLQAVELKVIRKSNVKHPQISITRTTSSSNNHENRQNSSRCPLCVDAPITLDDNQCWGYFATDINKKQRDQYLVDETKAVTGEKTGALSYLQGEKKHLQGNDKYKSLRPCIKIQKDILKNHLLDECKIRVYLVQEICEKGTRTLYHHPTCKFIMDDESNDTQNPISQSNQCFVSLQLNDKIFHKMGMPLEIKVHAILGAKICGHVGKDLFCHLTNRYSHEYNYRTNRLACVPEIAGEVMHQNLFVSGAFAFAKNEIVEPLEIKTDQNQIIEQIPIKTGKRKTNSSDSVSDNQCNSKKKKVKLSKTTKFAPNTSSNVADQSETILPTENILTGCFSTSVVHKEIQIHHANNDFRPLTTTIAAHDLKSSQNLMEADNISTEKSNQLDLSESFGSDISLCSKLSISDPSIWQSISNDF